MTEANNRRKLDAVIALGKASYSAGSKTRRNCRRSFATKTDWTSARRAETWQAWRLTRAAPPPRKATGKRCRWIWLSSGDHVERSSRFRRRQRPDRCVGALARQVTSTPGDGRGQCHATGRCVFRRRPFPRPARRITGTSAPLGRRRRGYPRHRRGIDTSLWRRRASVGRRRARAAGTGLVRGHRAWLPGIRGYDESAYCRLGDRPWCDEIA